MLAMDGDEREVAIERLDEATQLFEAEGQAHDAARAAADMSRALWMLGRIDEAIELLEPRSRCSPRTSRTRTSPTLAASRRASTTSAATPRPRGSASSSRWRSPRRRDFPEVLSQALNTKALILSRTGRTRRARCCARRSTSRSSTISSLRRCAPTTTCWSSSAHDGPPRRDPPQIGDRGARARPAGGATGTS